MSLILVQQSFEGGDGGEEVVAECAEQVDFCGKAKLWARMLRVYGGKQFAAARAEEDEASVAEFRRRPVAAEGGDGGGQRSKCQGAPEPVLPQI